MDIIAKDSGGHNIVAREQAHPRYYPPGTAPVAYVKVYWRYEGTPVGDAQYYGQFAPGSHVSFLFNPAVDRNILFAVVSYSADNVPDVSNLEDAVWTTVTFQRETDAPVIGQVGDATPDNVTVGISGYSQYARKRRVRIATSLFGGALNNPTETIFDAGAEPLPAYLDFTRGAGPQTIYVAVAHSSGTEWTPDSNILTLTFATAGTGGGNPTGGSGGNFDPTPHHYLEL